MTQNREVEVLVIGSGQAGLAMGYYMKRQKKSFIIVGQDERLGDSWRKRYDSLQLFTPRWFSGLPGLALKGDRNGYPGKDEIADYLEAYAGHHDLPVELGTTVFSLEAADRAYHISTNRGEYRAKSVVVATGPFQKPFVPNFSHVVPPEIYQVHTSHYRNPSQLKPGAVLVVGAGNSGAQIAVELSGNRGREVYLSVGHRLKFFPLDILGKSIFWWLGKLGILHSDRDGTIARFVRKQGEPNFGTEPAERIKQGKILLKPRTLGMVEGNLILFENFTAPASVQNIVWATGFRSDYGWIRIPGVLNGEGMPVHQRGVTSARGLYFLGLPWQQTRGSSLIGGVGADAEYLAGRLQSGMLEETAR